MICPEMTMADRTYRGPYVCALTMFAQSQHFIMVVLEHKYDVGPLYAHFWQLFSKTNFSYIVYG